MGYMRYAIFTKMFFKRFMRRAYVKFLQMKKSYNNEVLSSNEMKIFRLFKMVIQEDRALLQKSVHIFQVDFDGNEYTLDRASNLFSIKHNEYSSTFRVEDFLVHKLVVIFEAELEKRMKKKIGKRETAQGKMLSKIIDEISNKAV